MFKIKITKLSVILAIIITLITASVLFTTLAIDTESGLGSNMDIDYSFTFNLKDNINNQVRVSANSRKVLDFVIKNTNNGAIKYGLAYSSSSDLTNVKVAKLTSSKNDTVGIVTKNQILAISIIIENNSSNDITINLHSITGYENGGDLIVPQGQTLITEEYETYEVVISADNAIIEDSGSLLIDNTSIENTRTYKITLEEGYKIDSISCNNGQNATISENIITINNLTSDTVCNITTKVSNLDISGANTPDLVEGLIPIMYNGATWVKADKYNSNETYQWYDYNAKEWANAVLVSSTNRQTYIDADAGTPIPEDDILAYYVWIPRYRYKVWNINKVVGTDSYSAQTTGIDIEFEKEIETTGTITCTYSYKSPSSSANSPNETCTGSNGDYYTHPAFTFGDTPLRGIWVGKFEISSSSPSNWYGGGSSTSLSVRIKPNVISWRGNYVTRFSYVIQAMTNNSDYGISNDSDSHLIRNLEWGAVAYFAHSDYGLCANESCVQLGMNGYGNHDNTDRTAITGCGPISSGSSSNATKCNAYDTEVGMEASTTRNIYGIYDMRGGSHEYVMANSSLAMGSYSYNKGAGGSNFSYSNETAKYVDTYAYGTSSSDQTAYNRARLGDATGETPRWYGNEASFFSGTSYSWIKRSGYFYGSNLAGLFAFDRNEGEASEDYNVSARAVLGGI